MLVICTPCVLCKEGSFKSSEQWRTEGNAHFLAGKKQGEAPHVNIRRARLEKARECYAQVRALGASSIAPPTAYAAAPCAPMPAGSLCGP